PGDGERRPEHERQPVLHRHGGLVPMAGRQAHGVRPRDRRHGRRRRDLDRRPRRLRPAEVAGHDPASGAARGVGGAGVGTARRRRRTSQNPPSSAGPPPTAKTTVPTPTVPPRANPTASTASSSPARTTPSRSPVRSAPTTISESRGPAPKP